MSANKSKITTEEMAVLRRKGWPLRRIAEQAGVSMPAVAERLNRAGVLFRNEPVWAGPGVTVRVRAAKHPVFVAAMTKRKMTAMQLTNALVAVIVQENMFDAVLDDGAE